MMIRLLHTRPDGEVDTYHLKPGRKYHVGRGSVCEIRILDLKLSRKHCLLEFVDGSWRVEDLCSTNGCRVAGEQIVGPVKVIAGSVIEIGQSILRLADAAASDVETDDEATSADEVAAVTAMPHTAVPQSAPPLTLTPQSAPPAASAATKLQPASAVAATAQKNAVGSASDANIPRIEQEEMPESGEQRPIGRATVELDANNWEPEPAPHSVTASGALQPMPDRVRPPVSTGSQTATPATTPSGAAAIVGASAPPAPRPNTAVRPITIRIGTVDATPSEGTHIPVPDAGFTAPNSAATGANAGGAGEDRTFFITVLGRRIGPLSRGDARDLKARELRGQLTPADLERFPQP